LVGHIASPNDPIDPLRRDTLPSYPPPVVDQGNQAEIMAYQKWWEQDAIADHVVSTHLSSIVRASIPPDNIMGTRTARTIYDSIKTMYGLRGLADGLTIFNSLMALTCHPNQVQDFVVKWRAGVSQLHACRYPISARLLIQQFVCHLPRDAPAFYTLRASLLTRLQNIRDDDFQAVVLVTQEVLDLDSIFRPTAFQDPRGPRNNHQPSNFHSQQPQNPPASNSTPNSGQTTPYHIKRERPSDSGGQSGCREDRKEDCPREGATFGSKRDDQAGGRHMAHVFLADAADSPPDASPSSGNFPDSNPLENDWSAEPSSSIPVPDLMAFLTSSVEHQVNEDLGDDFYDHFSPQSYATLSPALSEALALISVSPDLVSKLNTVLDSGSMHHIV